MIANVASALGPCLRVAPAASLALLLAACPAPPTGQETPQPTGEALTPEEQELLTHVAEGLRDTCVGDSREPQTVPDEVVAAVECTPGDFPDFVSYEEYASQEEMDAIFDGFVSASDESEGDCAQGEEGYGPYSLGDEPVGRLLCDRIGSEDEGPGYFMLWTDERLNILASARTAEDDLSRLYDWWTGDESGPIE